MRLRPPTRFELDPSNLDPGTSTSVTPQRRRRYDNDNDDYENIDPALWSPSKKMRTLYAHLGASSAGSLLLSTPKIKSYNNPILPPVVQHVPCSLAVPNWSLSSPGPSQQTYKTRNQLESEIEELQKQLRLAHQNVDIRDKMLEEANATMVFQNLGLRKTNEALHQQEEKATTDRARLFKGKAQCLSSDEFYQAVAEIEEGRKAKEAGKEAKKAERQRKKALKEELEKQWAEMKRQHAAKVGRWETECARLTGLGTKKKDLPAKPKLAKKPQLPVVDDEDDDLDDDLMDEDEV
ncbi:hypothetical protein C8J57DRAFT_1098537 [Mycena rebaudengoi]|nr:hypothetical protein C8J57DRAFT_1098537 [Mycena rebaudengoi]